MNVEKRVKYIIKKYNEVRGAERGLIFKLPKKKRTDVMGITDVVARFQIENEDVVAVDNNGQLIFLVLGSNDIMDWIYNFMYRFKVVPYNRDKKDIKVHKGFYKSYQLVREAIHEYVEENGVKSVIVMGQSHGAAVATLMALDVQYNFPKTVVGCMTTGSPRVGNKSFVESYNKRVPNTLRFRIGNDPVTTLPFKFMGFSHVSSEIRIGKGTKCIFLRIKDHMLADKEALFNSLY